MSKKKKAREEMFVKGLQFANLSQAKQISEKEGKKLKFQLICAGISVLTTVAWLLFWFTGIEGTPAEDALAVPLILGWLAMLVGSNKNYIRYLGKSVKITWFLIPLFPIDLLMCIMGAVVFFIFSVYFPIVPCLMTVYQSYLTKKDADSYISAFESYAAPLSANEF